MHWLTRALPRLSLIALIFGCAGSAAVAAEAVAPVRILGAPGIISGARLVQAIDRAGTVSPLSASAPFLSFVHPVAVAQHGGDLYVADAALGRAFRVDAVTGLMAVLAQVPVSPGVRFLVGADFSLYVLDPPRRRVQRFSRDGVLLANYADARNLANPVAFAVDDAYGEVLVADGVLLHVLAFHPLGGAAHVISPRASERHAVLGIAGIALGPDGLHVSDPSCGCVAVLARDGSVLSTYGHREIGRPGAIAIDRHGRVFVADVLDRAVRVFAQERLLGSIPAASIGLSDVGDLSRTDAGLVVVGASGARVAVLRIAAPERRQ